jgi:hypothetical protein
MKAALLLLAVVFAVGFTVGATGTQDASAAGKGGGGSNCYYTCTCEGTPLKCCVTIFGTSCKVTDEIGCTQEMGC